MHGKMRLKSNLNGLDFLLQNIIHVVFMATDEPSASMTVRNVVNTTVHTDRAEHNCYSDL
jgi:hypothetical protein